MKNFSFPSDAQAERKKELLGDFFGKWPNDILLCSFAPKCDSKSKNEFNKTSLAFHWIFSWEDVKSFMLCKELCAHERDIKSLIIPILYKNKNEITKSESIFVKNMNERLSEANCRYDISGRHELILWKTLSEEGSNQSSLIMNKMGKCSDNIHPFIVACIARSPKKMALCLANDNSLKDLEHRTLGLHILIENNDALSLETFLKFDNCLMSENLSELTQLTLFHASNKIAKLINFYYKKSEFVSVRQSDFFAKWFDLINESPEFLDVMVEKHRDHLSKKHANHIDRYNECFSSIFPEK